eukprot:12920470-Prorocentrum_lima.AAC.1
MLLSVTNGHSETLTTTDIATAFLNAPIDESQGDTSGSTSDFDQVRSRKARHCLEDQKGSLWAQGKPKVVAGRKRSST